MDNYNIRVRDRIAMSMPPEAIPQADNSQSGVNLLSKAVGIEPFSVHNAHTEEGFKKALEWSLQLQVKTRYMYADAMLKEAEKWK